jgi:predicted nucleic acid-binding protein
MHSDKAVVCDASVLAAIAFNEALSLDARALTRSRRLYAPPLLRYEMAQTAVSKSASAGHGAPQVQRAFAASLRVPIKLVVPSWPEVVELARAHGLSAYDASYLQVALALRIRLATLDKRLAGVADRLGVKANSRGS